MLQPADFQPELALRIKTAKGGNEDAVRELCGLLSGRGWMTRREIQRLRPAWSERYIRKLAREAGTRLVSAPGSAGYCLESDVLTDDVRHACNAIEQQIQRMGTRLTEYRRLLGLRLAKEKLALSSQQTATHS